jgi:hypothetical protein
MQNVGANSAVIRPIRTAAAVACVVGFGMLTMRVAVVSVSVRNAAQLGAFTVYAIAAIVVNVIK